MEYKVYIIPPEGNPFDPLHRQLGIYVKQLRDGKQFALKRDGSTWEEVAEGTYNPDDYGLMLPAEAYPALLAAVERAQGRQHHSPTEAVVLREWLQAERDRNDKVFNALASPFPVFKQPTGEALVAAWDKAAPGIIRPGSGG